MEWLKSRFNNWVQFLGGWQQTTILFGSLAVIASLPVFASYFPQLLENPQEISRLILTISLGVPLGLAALVLTFWLIYRIASSIPRLVWQIAGGIVIGGVILKMLHVL